MHNILIRQGSNSVVVGLDFSGNPAKGTFAEFGSVMAKARQLGLRVTAHVAELPDHTDTAATIAFRPERYGHAVQITPPLLESMAATSGVVEICPTSNLKTLGLGKSGPCTITTSIFWSNDATSELIQDMAVSD